MLTPTPNNNNKMTATSVKILFKFNTLNKKEKKKFFSLPTHIFCLVLP